MPEDIQNSNGWKAFFTLLALWQAVIGFLLVRTLNKIDASYEVSHLVQITQERVILPRIYDLEDQIKKTKER